MGLELINLNVLFHLVIAWEKQHEQLSKFIEIEHESIKKSSPLRYNHSSIDTSGSSDSYYEKSSVFKNSGQAFHLSSDDEEEVLSW